MGVKTTQLIAVFVTSLALAIPTMNHRTEKSTGIVLARFVSPNPQLIRFKRFVLVQPNSAVESRSLVIGATDWLLQLDYQTFALLHNRSMAVGSPKPYHCKALICDEQRGWLIACGTNNHGQCSIHDLNNISQILHEPKESVISDQPDGSTVLLIGPGPAISSSANISNTALYVASTSNENSRSEIIATRSLQIENLMQLVYADISSGTRLYLNNAIAGHFYLEYIYAFQSEGFTFFVVVESIGMGKRNQQNKHQAFITKLVRICQKDDRYYSYTEVPLHCNSHVTVSRARRAFHLKSPSQVERQSFEHLIVIFDHHAVCMYQMWALQAQINANIAKCFDGQGFQNIRYIHSSFPPCQRTNMTQEDWICGSDVNQHLDTEDPIISTSLIDTENQRLTAVTASWIDLEHQTGILTLGTNNSVLLLYVLLPDHSKGQKHHDQQSKFKAIQYNHIDLVALNQLHDQMPILADMELMDGHHLIVMTKNNVFKLDVQQCSKHSSCSQCSVSVDPHCGWCLSTNQCTMRKSCPNQSDWIYLFNEHSQNVHCPRIATIEPSSIAINTRKTIRLFMKNFREPSIAIDQESQQPRPLYCVFNFFRTSTGKTHIITDKQHSAITVAKRIQQGQMNTQIKCPSPEPEQLPSIRSEHYLRSWLVVAMNFDTHFTQNPSTQTLTELSSGIEFRFWDCSSYRTCNQCVRQGSNGNCIWCISEHNCKYSEASCRMDRKLMVRTKTTAEREHIANLCPRFLLFNNKSHLLTVHEKLESKIQMKVLNYDVHHDDRIECRFQTTNSEQLIVIGHYNATQKSILCEPIVLNIPAKLEQQVDRVNLQVSINDYILDNPNNMNIQLYDCKRMAENCGQCLTLTEQYACGWCMRDQSKVISSSCEVSQHCRMDSQTKNGIIRWLNQSSAELCPNPIIRDFEPKSGPINGETTLTIKGENLGRTIDDIQIWIGLESKPDRTVECQPKKFDHASRLECELRTQFTNHSLQPGDYGHIMVKLRDVYEARSTEMYRFIRAQLWRLEPDRGPRSGGTRIRLFGENLDSGSTLTILLGSTDCIQQIANDSMIECLSNPFNDIVAKESERSESTPVEIVVQIDGVPVDMDKPLTFYFIVDPVIERVEHWNSEQLIAQYPLSIPSGGIRFFVIGQRLDSIQSPQFYVTIKENDRIKLNISSVCQHINASYITCESPSIIDTYLTTFNNNTQHHYGFIMDNVESVKSLTTNGNFEQFRLYRQPVFDEFKEPDQIHPLYEQEHLTLTGQHLDLLWLFSDQVTIAIGELYVCHLITTSARLLTCQLPQQMFNQNQRNNNAECHLLTVTVNIGHGMYTKIIGRLNPCPTNSIQRILIPGIVVVSILIVLILLLGLCQYRSCHQQRMILRENLEMEKQREDIEKELRNAHLELRLGIQKIVDENLPAPVRRFIDYLNNILFAQLEQPSLLPTNNIYSQTKFNRFGQLIAEREFLLLFIRTLDKDKTTSMKTRVRFGSYLVQALSHKLIYLTDVMITLLNDLIDRNLSQHPKLLLRRNDTIVERIVSVWLSLLLYDHLVTKPISQSLYHLYQAFNIHCYNGPVDEKCAFARNTMDQERMLRTNIGFKRLTIQVALIDYSMRSLADDDDDDDDGEHIYETLIYDQKPTDVNELVWHQVEVLDCDSINQVKRKALNILYSSKPYSQRRYFVDDLELQYINEQNKLFTFANSDKSNERRIEKNIQWSRLNTLAHYNIQENGSRFYLMPKESVTATVNSNSAHSSPIINRDRTKSVISTIAQLLLSQQQENNLQRIHEWHLDEGYHNLQIIHHNSNFSPSIYQTRRQITKEITQNYVDRLFVSIFQRQPDRPNDGLDESVAVCKPIKFLFDYFDRQAQKPWSRLRPDLNINLSEKDEFDRRESQDVAHIWKSNCLPLRFWVNIIKNPEFVLDVEKDAVIDANLSVVAQILMESCSLELPRLGENSPSSKLLFSREFETYNSWVRDYYNYLSQLNPVTHAEMEQYFEEFSQRYSDQVDRTKALGHLYEYVLKSRQMLSNEMDKQSPMYLRFQSLF
uniref:Plexin-A4-like n=1 Tax=Dermatophagoides pteronyssinus TaxID=6956 RepID=A0A6P6XQ22_DERPT|nr:plexin-A4-like [Dermatophagoides pteronyssinus]